MAPRAHRRISLALSLAGLVAAAVIVGACGGGGGSSNPVASPTPFNPTNCQVAWLTAAASQAGAYQVYVIDMPIANWTTGTKAFSPSAGGNSATFYYELDLSTSVAKAIGHASSGSFAVTAGGTTAGDSISVTDSAGVTLFDATGLSGAVIASGGTGTFDGVWSDPSPNANPVFGSSSSAISVVYAGSSLSIGAQGSLGICYQQSSFAPLTPLERAKILAGVMR
jgi:hypothetical protein